MWSSMVLLLGAGRSWKDVDEGDPDDLEENDEDKDEAEKEKHDKPKLRNAKDMMLMMSIS